MALQKKETSLTTTFVLYKMPRCQLLTRSLLCVIIRRGQGYDHFTQHGIKTVHGKWNMPLLRDLVESKQCRSFPLNLTCSDVCEKYILLSFTGIQQQTMHLCIIRYPFRLFKMYKCCSIIYSVVWWLWNPASIVMPVNEPCDSYRGHRVFLACDDNEKNEANR